MSSFSAQSTSEEVCQVLADHIKGSKGMSNYPSSVFRVKEGSNYLSPNYWRHTRQCRWRGSSSIVPSPAGSPGPGRSQPEDPPGHRECHQSRDTRCKYSSSHSRPQLAKKRPQGSCRGEQLSGAHRSSHQQRRHHGDTVHNHRRWSRTAVWNKPHWPLSLYQPALGENDERRVKGSSGECQQCWP